MKPRLSPHLGRLVPLLAALLLAFSALPSLAQDWKGRGRVQGIVTNAAGDPVEGAQVTLRQQGGSEGGPEVLTTNKKGRWTYLGLTGGTWKATIEHPDYAIAEGPMRVSEFGSNEILETQLKSASAVAASSGGSKVDAAAAAAAANAAEASDALSRAGALIDQGNYDEGRALMEEALAKLDASRQPAILLAIARTHFAQDNVEQTLATLERALVIDPNHVDSLKMAGSVLVNEGREAEAEAYMARLPQGQTIDPSALLNQGIRKYNEGDLDGALADFDGVVASNPNLADAYYYRGLVYLGKANNEASKADFAKMLELDSDHPNAAEAREFLEYLSSQ